MVNRLADKKVERLLVRFILCLFVFNSASSCFAADRFGAIAYSQSTRRYGYAWGKATQADADNTALKECGAADAFIAVYGTNQWLALAHGNGTSFGWGHDTTEQAAQSRAIDGCAKRASGCHVLVSIYAGGQGKATIVVKVPAGVRVFAGQYEVAIENGVGQFESQILLGGKEYTYELTAISNVDGDNNRETVVVDVMAFQTTRVTFPNLELFERFGPLPRLPKPVPKIPQQLMEDRP